jgi:tetratricopeptide (TPR) repeat protein
MVRVLFVVILCGLGTGCAELAQLTYGRYLLEAARYEEAYPYLKEAAELANNEEARRALVRCGAAWADQLAAEAEALRRCGRTDKAFELLRTAAELCPAPRIVDPLVSLEERLRVLAEGKEELTALLAAARWKDAVVLAERLRTTVAPYDAELYLAARRACEKYGAACAARARALAAAGDFRAAGEALPVPGFCAIGPVPPGAATRPGPRERDGLAERIDRALAQDRLLASAGAALEKGRLDEAFRLYERARRDGPDDPHLLLRLRLVRQRLEAASAEAVNTALLSGDIRNSFAVLGQIRAGSAYLPPPALARYETRLHEQLRHEIAGHLANGRAGNALLLMGTAREVFPAIDFSLEFRARRAFDRSVPRLRILDRGGDDTLDWTCLGPYALPAAAEGDAAVTVSLGEPVFTIVESPPAFGFELREVADAFRPEPHPERLKLLEELGALRATPPPHSHGDPWERDMAAHRTVFRSRRLENRERQLARLPHRTHCFAWRRVRTKIAYRQLKAELARPVTASVPGEPEPVAETITASRSYQAKLPPDEDPFVAGAFPSPDQLRRELETAFRAKAVLRMRALFDRALTAELRRGVRLAGQGKADHAIALLCRVCAVRGQGLKAPQEAEQLLGQTWSREAVAYLLAGGDRSGVAGRDIPPGSAR